MNSQHSGKENNTATILVKTQVSNFPYKIQEQHVLCFYHA